MPARYKRTMAKGKNIPSAYSSIKIIAAYKKVLQVLDGEIPQPEVIEIFLTNYCNFSCPHCRCKELHGDRNQRMEPGIFEKLLAELHQKGIANIVLSGGGEPLAHPDIAAIFDLMLHCNVRAGVITNGYKLADSDGLVEKIVRCSDWLSFSVDGFSDETYQKVHGRSDISYGRLKKTITMMAELPKRPTISIKMLVSALNVHEINLAIEESLEMKADYLQFKLLENHKLKLEDRDRYMGLFAEKIASIGDMPLSVSFSSGHDIDKKEKCLLNVLHPVVDWDGTIYLCCFFEHRKEKHSIGNIYNGGFFNHWVSKERKEKIEGIDGAFCAPTCPIMKYNDMVEFIRQNHNHFRYI